MDPNIDPTLQTDPALNFLNTLSFDNLASRGLDGNDSDDDLPESSGPAAYCATPMPPSSLTNFGRMLKRQHKLSTESEGDLNLYCANSSNEERSALAYLALLQTRDLLKQLHKVDDWQVPNGLKKSIRSYTQAFMLSPTTSSYRGNGPEHILKAMRELNVRDLPPEKDVTHGAAVLAVIKTTLTTFRNVIKDKIKSSLETDSPTRNIADLTHAIINNTAVKATAQLYIRIAFLRWHYVQYPDLNENDWWPHVDSVMEAWRTTLRDATRISVAFNELYQKDVTAFGDPADTTHTTIEPKDVVAWIGTVNNHAANVQGKTGSKKRKTTAS